MAANIVNAGTPLSGAGSQSPLWTDQCDTSSNLTNNIAPSPLVLSIPVSGVGTVEADNQVEQLDQIEKIVVTGTLKGKLGDIVSINLVHETLGKIPILQNKEIRGPLSTAYPLPVETRAFVFGESIPAGYVFDGYVGQSFVQSLTLPENINPNDYFFNSSFYGFVAGYTFQVYQYVPGASPHLITVPAHRYPYTPDYNYDNAPGNAIVTGSAPPVIVYRGFRYTVSSTGPAEPFIVQNLTFDNQVVDTGPSTPYSQYQPTPWNKFLNNYNVGYGGNAAFSETLYTNYGAHDWVVTSVTRNITPYTYFNGSFPASAFRVVDTYAVTFIKWQDVVWSVQPLASVTWNAIFPPKGNWKFYPPDYYDYQSYAERSETLNITALDWKGLPADGRWTVEYIGKSTDVPVNASPTVPPSLVNINDLKVTINFKGNDPYVSANLAPSVSGSVKTIYTQGNLRADGHDRAFIGILCGIQGSTMRGVLAGYSVLRIGRTGEVYNVSYLLATVCNINHVNSPRTVKSIDFWAQNWGDRPFSTRGDAGEAFVQGSTQYRIYPIRGQIGLTVKIAGTKLDFFLNGQYPVLSFIDPTVALIDTFTRVSLDA